MQVFIVELTDARVIRIKASHFTRWGDKQFAFYKENLEKPSALFWCTEVYCIIAQDMLLEDFQDGSFMPDIMDVNKEYTDFIHETLFSEAGKEPFTPSERKIIKAAIDKAKEEIPQNFCPNEQEFREIVAKLDYLSDKVNKLDKFNWKRLFVATLVGVSVDLGFGTMIPSTLTALFTEIFSHLADKLRLGRGKDKRSG